MVSILWLIRQLESQNKFVYGGWKRGLGLTKFVIGGFVCKDQVANEGFGG